MKSLPEHEFWKAVSGRLDQYSEDPAEDDWDKIRAALPPPPSNARFINRTSDVLTLTLLAFLLGFQIANLSNNRGGAPRLSDASVQRSLMTENGLDKEKEVRRAE